MRSFLRYLRYRGLVDRDLSRVVRKWHVVVSRWTQHLAPAQSAAGPASL